MRTCAVTVKHNLIVLWCWWIGKSDLVLFQIQLEYKRINKCLKQGRIVTFVFRDTQSNLFVQRVKLAVLEQMTVWETVIDGPYDKYNVMNWSYSIHIFVLELRGSLRYYYTSFQLIKYTGESKKGRWRIWLYMISLTVANITCNFYYFTLAHVANALYRHLWEVWKVVLCTLVLFNESFLWH